MSRWKPGPESEDFKAFWEEWVTYPSPRVDYSEPDYGPEFDLEYEREYERQMREQYDHDCRAMHAEAIEAYLEAGGILLPGWVMWS
jgi:hypothetical protein